MTKEKLLAIEALARRRGAGPSTVDALPYDWALAVEHLRDRDPVLGRHIERIGSARALTRKTLPDTFTSLAESIVYQQLSGKAAATIFGRLTALFPDGFTPDAVLAAADADLRGAGISAAKLASLRDLADRTARGEVPSVAALDALEDEAIVERLTVVRGIGRWTVQMLLIFRLGRPDVLPIDDYGVRKGYARVFRRRAGSPELPSKDEIAKRGARWGPFRSVASFYLWRALDEGGVVSP